MTTSINFKHFSEVENNLVHMTLYLVSFPDDYGSPQLIMMRWNSVAKEFAAVIENSGCHTIHIRGEQLLECSISELKFY